MAGSKTNKAVAWGIVAMLVLAGTVLFFEGHNIAHGIMVAEGKRAVARHIATPIDLTDHYGVPASALENGSSFWGKVPWGFQVFHHVPLQIGGLISLWGAGNAKAGAVFPEAITGIAVNQKFETLYIYHCTFYGSPRDTPVYDVVFRYVDGESETNTIRYGVDVVDFNTPGGNNIRGPSGRNSKTAWIGSSFTPDGKHPLLFSLTAVKNPRPYARVVSIDLYSCKNKSAGCILAMTTGPADLMR